MIVKTNPKELEPYLEDASYYKGNADKLFLPENEKEISEILAEHHAKKIPITVSGARTGLTGAAVPEGGSILATDRLNHIKTIEDDFAIVEPGVLLETLFQALKDKKLFYPPDPGEWKAFLGGTVATNASGPRAFKYGTTRNWIRRLKIVLPTGEILNVVRDEILADRYGRIRIPFSAGERTIQIPSYSFPISKNAAGYFSKPGMDLIDLLIGAEGTLGVVTEIEIALLPLPKHVLALIMFFAEEVHSWEFVREARLISKISANVDSPAELEARSIEYFDEYSLQFLRPDYPHIPEMAKAAIYIEQEFDWDQKPYLENWFRLIRKHKGLASETWVGTSNEQREEFREFRYALPVKINDWLRARKQVKIGTDMAVPDEGFRPFMEFQKRALDEAKLHFAVFGHIGDNHVHLNILPSDDGERVKAKELYLKFIREAVRLSGTISGEHGIGKLKRAYLKEMFDEKSIHEMVAVKKCFDPNGILNRGNLFTEEDMV